MYVCIKHNSIASITNVFVAHSVYALQLRSGESSPKPVARRTSARVTKRMFVTARACAFVGPLFAGFEVRQVCRHHSGGPTGTGLGQRTRRSRRRSQRDMVAAHELSGDSRSRVPVRGQRSLRPVRVIF